MADKEERILIDIIENGLNCVYRMDNDPKGLSLCKHNGEEEPVSEKDCKNCLEGMTRQEAVEIIAKRIISKQEAVEIIAKRITFEGVKYFECQTIARWCLDALLEGVKK